MRALLRDMPPGLPGDCLLARIKGRRSFLLADWERRLFTGQPLATLGPAPWRRTATGGTDWALHALQEEHLWVLARMDERLRRAAAPFFWLRELGTLATCLRLLASSSARVNQLLRDSLLRDDIRQLLLRSSSCDQALTGLAPLLARFDQRFSVLADTLRDGGHGALETALQEASLAYCAESVLHPAIQRYCALTIDSRNLTTIAKRLRWRLETLPPLLAGGTISLKRLHEIFLQRNSSGLLRLAMQLGGEAPYDLTAPLEQVLHASWKRVMSRLARETDGIGAIIDYLWRCGNEAANIALLEQLETAGAALAGMEMRQ